MAVSVAVLCSVLAICARDNPVACAGGDPHRFCTASSSCLTSLSKGRCRPLAHYIGHNKLHLCENGKRRKSLAGIDEVLQGLPGSNTVRRTGCLLYTSDAADD